MERELLRYNKGQKYICFDFETCDLNLIDDHNKPWQLSFLIAQGDKILEEKDYYIRWPDLQLSDEARVITKFNDSKYKRLAVDPEELLEDFEKYLYDDDYIIVGQNLLGFDVYIHNIFRKLLGKTPKFGFIPRIYDTNCFAKAIALEVEPPRNGDLIYWQYKLNDFRKRGLRTSIKAQLKKYKIDFDEEKLHNSLYDVRMNYKIFQKQIWQIEI